ncbi:horcolin-like [Carex rostrata]
MASTQVVIKKVGPVGGTGGVVKDMNISGVNRIIKISVHYGSVIDCLTVRFLHDNGEESTEVWGLKGGDLVEFNLEDSEYITSVKGHYGASTRGIIVLRSLKFETNMRSFGPYGTGGELPFELPAISGQIIGFHGRSGWYLDALGVYVKDTEESIKKELEDCKQNLKQTEANYLKLMQNLRAELDNKNEIQKKLESEIESLKIKNDELPKLRAELANKDEIQKKLESEIESLKIKNDELPKLRAELANKDEIKKKLESER